MCVCVYRWVQVCVRARARVCGDACYFFFFFCVPLDDFSATSLKTGFETPTKLCPATCGMEWHCIQSNEGDVSAF